jgi:hypothetical protein
VLLGWNGLHQKLQGLNYALGKSLTPCYLNP